ncbi:unnamed protein product [Vicia faba]|uniref:Transposase MuDR plant domain-containing protein n=1 Tax=Vicia faba TaxID=3906 RepID=A0AAV1B1G9_VICFA|nr:unnamed protein product [Vicia faba]
MDSSFKIEDVKIWWKSEHGSLENDLKPLVNDEDATMLAMCVKETKYDVEIYTKARLSSVGVHNGDGTDQMNNADGTCQMDNGQGIHKRMTTTEMDREHVIDDGYITNELDSGADDDSDDRPSVTRFNEDENLRKEFKIKVEMKFSSLKQFKKAVLEHNVLNGREVKFAKNVGTRCRVVCKDKQQCDYTVLCNKVFRTTSFRIKTRFQKHKCGRKFFNKNANADWVSRVIIVKLKNNSTMKLNELVADVRLRFATEITRCRTFKARQLARKIVEGDSTKQYNMLWSYEAELRRASKGNTCKLNISGLPPRLKRCYMCFDGTKKALKVGCRPFIGLDECHIINKYGGILQDRPSLQ